MVADLVAAHTHAVLVFLNLVFVFVSAFPVIVVIGALAQLSKH